MKMAPNMTYELLTYVIFWSRTYQLFSCHPFGGKLFDQKKKLEGNLDLATVQSSPHMYVEAKNFQITMVFAVARRFNCKELICWMLNIKSFDFFMEIKEAK